MSSVKVWVMTIDALNGQGQPVTLRYASGKYDAESVFYEPRIKDAGLFEEGLFSGGILPSQRSSYGRTTLINVDGFLNNLVDYAIDGRKVSLFLSENGGMKQPVFISTAQRFEFDQKYVSILLRSPSEPLSDTRSLTTFLGNNVLPNGVEGVEADIKGNPKPRLYGEVSNYSPVMVNTSRLIYQVSDTNDCVVSNLFDNGIALQFDGQYTSLAQMQTTPPLAGRWRRFNGYVRLGSSPVGQITVNASSNTPLLGDCFNRIAQEAGYTVSSGISLLNQRSRCRLIATQEESYLSLLDKLAASAGVYWRILPSNQIEVGLISTPSTTSSLIIYDYMNKQINRNSSGSGSNGVPIYKVTVLADKVETVQTELAGAATEAYKARVANQWRKAFSTNSSTKTRHILSEEYKLESQLSTLTAAQTLSQDILNLLSVRRDSVSIELVLSNNISVSLLSTVTLKTNRLGYGSGRNMLVIGKTYDAVKNKLTLHLWG